MRKFWRMSRPALVGLLVFTVICGVVYPAVVTVVAQVGFSDKADGSLIEVKLKDGSVKTVGSALIGQEFTKPEYLIGRPTGVSNLSVMSAEEKKLVEERVSWWRKFDPDNQAKIPNDLVTQSASGVDPNISPEAAAFQLTRIAKARGLTEAAVQKVIDQYTTDRFLGIWGNPTVNVLKVNLALDGLL